MTESGIYELVQLTEGLYIRHTATGVLYPVRDFGYVPNPCAAGYDDLLIYADGLDGIPFFDGCYHNPVEGINSFIGEVTDETLNDGDEISVRPSIHDGHIDSDIITAYKVARHNGELVISSYDFRDSEGMTDE